MTTPTIASTKLGDFFSVQLGPKVPVPIMNGIPGQSVTLANQDLVNSITISRVNTVAGGAIIPALGSVTVDASTTIWGTAPANTLPVLVFPGGANWAPSPAQVAASINALGLATAANQTSGIAAVNSPAYGPSTLAQQVTQQTAIPNNIATTGVPLLALPTNLFNVSNTSVTAGSNAVIGTAAVTQVGYEITVSCHSTGVTATEANIQVTWTDTVTSTTIDQQTWWITPGTDNSTNIHTIKGFGPTEGNQVSIRVAAVGNTVVFDQVIMNQNSRVYPRHDWRTWRIANLAGGVTAAISDIPANVLFQFSVASVATGGHTTQYTGLFSGLLQLWGHTSSNTTDATLQINAAVDTNLSSTNGTLAIIQSDASGNINLQMIVPRVSLQVIFTNNNAASKALSASGVMKDD